MSIEYAKLVERDESPLFVSLIGRGVQRPYFVSGVGWDYGVADYRYEDCTYLISVEDRSHLRETILAGVEGEPDFWERYIDRCHTAGKQLTELARQIGQREWSPHDGTELRDAFGRFVEATKTMVPFLVATIAVQAVYEGLLTERIKAEIPSGHPEGIEEILPRLLVSADVPKAVEEIRRMHALAIEALDEGHAEHIRSRPAPAALDELASTAPKFVGRLAEHVAEFGWLRTHGYRGTPPTQTQLLERLGVILRRWDRDALLATQVPPEAFDLNRALGFNASEALARDVATLRVLISLRFFRIDVHNQSFVMVRGLFSAVGETLGCTGEELVFAVVDEIERALDGEESLRLDELKRRMANSFVLARREDDLSVTAYEQALVRAGRETASDVPLTGMSASEGRVTAIAKVVFNPAEADKVDLGDVLITTMTTPDLMFAIEKAGAIVTDEGGILSHAAIISRELGIPCVIGTEHATRQFADGAVVEVDATEAVGTARRIDLA